MEMYLRYVFNHNYCGNRYNYILLGHVRTGHIIGCIAIAVGSVLLVVVLNLVVVVGVAVSLLWLYGWLYFWS